MNINKFIFWGFIFSLYFSPAYAQPPENRTPDLTRPIKALRIENLRKLSPLDKLFTPRHSRIGQKWSQSDLSSFLAHLYSSGLFRTVSAKTDSSQGIHTLVLIVEENPIIETLQIKGNSAFSTDFLLSKITSRPQSILNLSTLNQDQQILERLYLNAGYDLMRVSTISIENGTLTFTLTEGRIASLSVIGLSRVAPFVAYRELRLKSGDPFNSKILREDRESLLQLGYFSDISYPFLQLINTQNRTVGITLNVQEHKTNLIDVGIEQDTSKVVLFVQNSWHHFFINSDHINTKLQYGADANNVYKVTSYSLQYGQPWLFNRYPIGANLDFWEEFHTEYAGIDPESQVLVDNKRKGQQVSLLFPILHKQLTLLTRFKNEDILPLQNLGNTSAYTLRAASLQLQYRNLETLVNPKSGDYGAIEFEKGGNFGIINVGGMDFNRVVFSYSRFFGLTPSATIGTHFTTGAFTTTETSFTTFETEAFSIGGSNTLRGYKEAFPFIGTRRLLFNFEYRHDISDWLQAVAFYDVGRVFKDQDFLSGQNWHSGKGLGLRFFTPIAPLRFDMAWGENNGWLLHFGLGQIF